MRCSNVSIQRQVTLAGSGDQGLYERQNTATMFSCAQWRCAGTTLKPLSGQHLRVGGVGQCCVDSRMPRNLHQTLFLAQRHLHQLGAASQSVTATPPASTLFSSLIYSSTHAALLVGLNTPTVRPFLSPSSLSSLSLSLKSLSASSPSTTPLS